MRADPHRRGAVDWVGPETAAQVLVTYSNSGAIDVWRLSGEAVVQTAKQLLDSGYPQPGGDVYVCLRIAEPLHPPATSGLEWTGVRMFASRRARSFGAPILATWSELVGTKLPA